MPREWIVERTEIERIFAQARVARLATCTDDQPYVVPVFFAYHQGVAFIHSSSQGRKIHNIRLNPRVCLEVDRLHSVIPGNTACDFSAHNDSALAFGHASILEDKAEVVQALNLLVQKYARGRPVPPMATEDLDSWPHLTVVKIVVDGLSGKRNLEQRASLPSST